MNENALLVQFIKFIAICSQLILQSVASNCKIY